MKSVKASSQGLVQIKSALAQQGWNEPSERYRLSIAASRIIDHTKDWEQHWKDTGSFADYCSTSSRERFLKGVAIRQEAFEAFCLALGLDPSKIAENWEPASDQSNSHEQQELPELGTYDLQGIRYACRKMMRQKHLLPPAQKRLQKALDTVERRISTEKNELTQIPLPENFKVYVKGESPISHPEPGYEEKELKTINLYKGKDGGYVGCYSHNRELGVCSVGSDIYLIGQIRLPGKYSGRIFVPKGCEGKEIRNEN